MVDNRRRRRRALVILPFALLLLAGWLRPLPSGGAALPQAQGTLTAATDGGTTLYPQTGYRVGSPATDPFGSYFAARGGIATFGYPVSRPFTLLGTRVQLFQRYALQQLGNGVGLLNILDEDTMPYTDFGSASIPAVDPALAAGAPPPGTTDYGSAVSAYIAQTVPNTWQGQPVGFLDAFLQPGRLSSETDPMLQTLLSVEVLGFPTSAPAPDPRNNLFVYQRFQRTVLQYDASTGLTQSLLMTDYLKVIITGGNLPPQLASQAQGSRFFLQYRPGRPGRISRPADLPDTDLTMAFEMEGTGSSTGSTSSTGAVAQPTAPPAPPTSVPPFPVQALPPSASSPGQGTPLSGAMPGADAAQPGAPTATTTPTRTAERPIVDVVEPGGAQVGQDVVLRGRNFGDTAGQVLFTAKLATATVWSNDTIIVTVPQGTVDGTLRIRRADGVISNSVGFAPYTTQTPTQTPGSPTPTFTPTPSPTVSPTPTSVRPGITSIEPYFGPVGSSILIRGTGFGPTTGNVLLGNQTAPVQLWSDTSVVVNVPNGADIQPLRTQRLRVVRTDGAVSEPLVCYIVSPGTPTPTPASAGPPTVVPVPSTTPIPTAPTGC